MKKVVLITVLAAGLMGVASSMADVIFEDDFTGVTSGAITTPDANGWVISGVPYYSNNLGVGNSDSFFLRNLAAKMRQDIDLTASAVISTDFTLSFDGWFESSNTDGSEVGYVEITTDSGANWTTIFSLAITSPLNIDYDLPAYTGPYSTDIDASTWTAGQLAGFGFQFSQVATHNVDHFNVDNVELSVTVVPEPATVGMLGLGALVSLLIRRMRA